MEKQVIKQVDKKAIDNMFIVIPCFKPDEKLVQLIEEIRAKIGHDFSVILVDDGSGEEYTPIFHEAEKRFHCTVLTHKTNGGKGKAIKKAFNYILENFPESNGVITVDADGQHKVDDVLNCLYKLSLHPDEVIFGSRNFDESTVPFRSQLGNKWTRWIVKGLHGVKLSDTQTGLRAISTPYLKQLISITGDRYEYEMNMILYLQEHGIKIREVPIETVYIEENQTSNFRPVVDSYKVYSTFLKYGFNSLASFLMDIGLFRLSIFFLQRVFPVSYIVISTVIARIFSSLFNYMTASKLVFKKENSWTSLRRYYILAALQMLASGYLVTYVVHLLSARQATLVKVGIDLFLFVISFQFQRVWVFPQHRENRRSLKKKEHETDRAKGMRKNET